MNILVPITGSFPLSIKKFFIGVGFALCLTIIGILPGVILIIIGKIIPSLMTEAACPACKNKLLFGNKNGACNCFYCHTRLLIKNGVLTTIDRKIYYAKH
jgi:DNA-directed RNA polymerase subunit RPC12/RpoP